MSALANSHAGLRRHGDTHLAIMYHITIMSPCDGFRRSWSTPLANGCCDIINRITDNPWAYLSSSVVALHPPVEARLAQNASLRKL